jgi:hypothetical protein
MNHGNATKVPIVATPRIAYIICACIAASQLADTNALL